jgi:S-DNA-T family DNA segregation ATPase FtsK/SpoIIIE
VDECQVWFEHPEDGKELEEIYTDLVKRGPVGCLLCPC